MAAKTIVLKGKPMLQEGKAGGAITPGHLLKEEADGDMVVHDTVGGNATPRFAVENSYEGKQITDAYTTGERVYYVSAYPSCEINAILATSQTVLNDDMLESNGDGTLRKHTPPDEGAIASGDPQYVRKIVAQACEDKTTTGATARIIARVV